MANVFLALVGVLGILLTSELLWRSKIVRGEYARKFVHICSGGFIAFWPYFMSWRTIQVISLAFLLVVILSKSFKIFHAIHDVKRTTYGEELFSISILLSSMLTREAWIFAMSVLTMTLSDGLAAVIGTAYGKRRRYRVFGHAKSWTGSATFFLMTFLLLVGLSGAIQDPVQRNMILMAAAPVALILTLIEAVSIKGSDNITIPIATMVMLRALTM